MGVREGGSSLIMFFVCFVFKSRVALNHLLEDLVRATVRLNLFQVNAVTWTSQPVDKRLRK